MTVTPSSMQPLGMNAPDFSLPDVVTDTTISLADFAEKKALLIIFLSRHCPYVQHVKEELTSIGNDYQEQDVAIVAISSNDIESHPQDSPQSLKEFALEENFPFPILYDETQEVARAYHATCTPDFYLFNESRELVYRGQLDDSRPGNNQPLTGNDVRAALDAVLSDEAVPVEQKPSTGCNIKWKPDNEPAA
ncbi:thioredoxin family protein [Candidatus Microgenomates bacterium]|nr:MAG: thioredoxin family protein [Candidatus Microgenomates bacterium]